MGFPLEDFKNLRGRLLRRFYVMNKLTSLSSLPRLVLTINTVKKCEKIKSKGRFLLLTRGFYDSWLTFDFFYGKISKTSYDVNWQS